MAFPGQGPPRPSPAPPGFPGEGTPPHTRFLPSDASLQWTPGLSLALSWPVSWLSAASLSAILGRSRLLNRLPDSEAQTVSNVSVVT